MFARQDNWWKTTRTNRVVLYAGVSACDVPVYRESYIPNVASGPSLYKMPLRTSWAPVCLEYPRFDLFARRIIDTGSAWVHCTPIDCVMGSIVTNGTSPGSVKVDAATLISQLKKIVEGPQEALDGISIDQRNEIQRLSLTASRALEQPFETMMRLAYAVSGCVNVSLKNVPR